MFPLPTAVRSMTSALETQERGNFAQTASSGGQLDVGLNKSTASVIPANAGVPPNICVTLSVAEFVSSLSAASITNCSSSTSPNAFYPPPVRMVSLRLSSTCDFTLSLRSFNFFFMSFTTLLFP